MTAKELAQIIHRAEGIPADAVLRISGQLVFAWRGKNPGEWSAENEFEGAPVKLLSISIADASPRAYLKDRKLTRQRAEATMNTDVEVWHQIDPASVPGHAQKAVNQIVGIFQRGRLAAGLLPDEQDLEPAALEAFGLVVEKHLAGASIAIHENAYCLEQYRHPRSGKGRIRRKWAKRPENFRPSDRLLYVEGFGFIGHPATVAALRRVIDKMAKLSG